MQSLVMMSAAVRYLGRYALPLSMKRSISPALAIFATSLRSFGSSSTSPRTLSTLRYSAGSLRGMSMRKTMCTFPLPSPGQSMPPSLVATAAYGRFSPSMRACGTARPSIMTVEPHCSRSSTLFTSSSPPGMP